MIKMDRLKLCLLFVFVLFVLVATTANEAYALWYNANWGFRQKITIDESMIPDNGPLSDFPVFIQLSSADSNPVFSNARSDGHDILFTQADGITLLSHEIEKYNSATEDMDMWVRIPGLLSDTTDTVIYMYYGNPGASADPSTASTWNSSFVMVQHLQETTGTHSDSTSNSNDGTAFGGVTQNVAGQINGADEFDGIDGYIAIQNLNYNTTGQIDALTVCAWFNTSFGGSGWTDNWSIVDFDRSEYYNFFIYGDTGEIGFSTTSSTPSTVDMQGNTAANDGSWHHACIVFDSSQVNDMIIYLDGALDVQQDNYSTGINLGTGTTRYGFIGDGSEADVFNGNRNNTYYEGFVDEVRISNIARSSDWIEASFNNQYDPSSFLSFDAQQVFTPAPTMTEWGMIIFILIAGLISVYYLKRKGVV